MSEQDLQNALSKRGAVETLLALNKRGRTEWLNRPENVVFRMYRTYNTAELKIRLSELSAEIHDLRTLGSNTAAEQSAILIKLTSMADILQNVSAGLSAADPYETISASNKSDKVNVRKIFLEYCAIEDNQPVCMYTLMKHSKVKCAHILPRSSKLPVVSSLSMKTSDVDSTKNLLWLCPGIENAFDQRDISFVPVLGAGLFERYKMKVWNEKCLDNNLGIDSDLKLRDVYLEGKYLDLTITKPDGTTFVHEIFKRCLAYQAICCYRFYNSNELPISGQEYGSFSSLSESNWKAVSKTFGGKQIEWWTQAIVRDAENDGHDGHDSNDSDS